MPKQLKRDLAKSYVGKLVVYKTTKYTAHPVKCVAADRHFITVEWPFLRRWVETTGRRASEYRLADDAEIAAWVAERLTQ